MVKYDVGIIGAGVAGSCLAILLAKAGKKVVIFEKESYPSHKVCGEFISLESYDFFESLGLPLGTWNLPLIKNLKLTGQYGSELRAPLSLGGFGLSRYKLDFELMLQMRRLGVNVQEQTKVLSVDGNRINTTRGEVGVDLVIGAHGKYAPAYLQKVPKFKSANFIGVKYHIQGNFAADEVALHSFKGGYCGTSKVENDTFCLCYLVNAEQLRNHGNQINSMEENVLFKNQYLKKIFEQAKFVWDKPLVVSNVKFSKQKLMQNEVILLGDAAGSISPLSGNGMSIAARGAWLLSQILLDDKILDHGFSSKYNEVWDRNFGGRVAKANVLNTIMLNPRLHQSALWILNHFSPLRNKVIRDMQGKPFGINRNG